jgi:pyruvate/2-oxoglutarate/acetoin dehydrogenase E1 component
MAEARFVDAVRQALFDEMAADNRVVVMGEEVASLGGVFTATRGLVEEYGKGRVLDAPLAEASLAGFAMGAATEGLRPVVEIMFSDFVTLAMDQIVNHAAKLRFMSNEQFSVPIVFRLPGGAGTNHGPQHSQSLESWFAHVPGLVVAMPGTPNDGYWMLRHCISVDDPVVFLENKGMYFGVAEEIEPSPPQDPWAARVARSGTDLTIVTAGRMLGRCMEAATQVESVGVNCEVVDLRFLWPMDVQTVLESVERTSRLLVVTESVEFSGWGAEVSSRVAESGFELLDAPIIRLGAKRSPIPVGPRLEDQIVPTVETIVEAIARCMNY